VDWRDVQVVRVREGWFVGAEMEAEAASATVGAAAAHRRAKGSSHRNRNRKVGSHSGESGEAEEDAKRAEAEVAEAAEEPRIMPSPPPSPPPETPPETPPEKPPISETDRLRAELENIRAQLRSFDAEGGLEAGSSPLGASGGLRGASTTSSLDSLPHGSSSGSALSAFDSSLFQFPPLDLHSLFDRKDDTQVDSKLHLVSGLGTEPGSSGLGGISLGSRLTGGGGGSELGSLLDSQLKSNDAPQANGSTPTQGGAGTRPRRPTQPQQTQMLACPSSSPCAVRRRSIRLCEDRSVPSACARSLSVARAPALCPSHVQAAAVVKEGRHTGSSG
jgi:hypothetical protein